MRYWADILDECDAILASAFESADCLDAKICRRTESQITSVLHFTAFLFENTFNRSIYNSMDVGNNFNMPNVSN